jgi:hypothetical protein
MTRAQEAYISVAKDSDVKALIESYGFDVVGPTSKGVFMFRELNAPNGNAWLLTEMRGKVAPSRQMMPSFWSDANVEAMKTR